MTLLGNYYEQTFEMSKDYFAMAKERIEAAELQTSRVSSIMPDVPIDQKTDIEDTW